MSSETVNVVLNDSERAVERWRHGVGGVLAPVVLVGLLLTPMPGLKVEASRLAAILASVVVLWVTEALPLPVTALIGASMCVVCGVAPVKDVFAPFADPLMFLFVGSFILARAIFLHGLDRRLAFGVLSLGWVGARPGRILFAFGAVTALLSAWISNTATTAMMFAIGMSILGFLFRSESGGGSIRREYATGMMLMTSFAASIGGLATPIGTVPNLIGLSHIRQSLGVEFSFFKWTLIGVPVVVVLVLYLYVYLNYFCRAGTHHMPGADEMLRREHRELGSWTTGQISTLVAFLVTVVLWVAPGVAALCWGEKSSAYQMLNRTVPDAVAALLGAALLFVLPGNRGGRAITWQEAAQIDWGVVLLYGGGFALGVLSDRTGLATAVGHALAARLPLSGEFGLLVAATCVAAMVSETTSNTASANIVLPMVIAIARGAKVDPLLPALGATFGASLGFMMPVSTPCNAIVYGSGYIPLARMIRYGLLLDVAGVIVIVTLIWLIAPGLR